MEKQDAFLTHQKTNCVATDRTPRMDLDAYLSHARKIHANLPDPVKTIDGELVYFPDGESPRNITLSELEWPETASQVRYWTIDYDLYKHPEDWSVLRITNSDCEPGYFSDDGEDLADFFWFRELGRAYDWVPFARRGEPGNIDFEILHVNANPVCEKYGMLCRLEYDDTDNGWQLYVEENEDILTGAFTPLQYMGEQTPFLTSRF